MIAVTVYKKSGRYHGFRCMGHAEYTEDGYDPVCAGVSALTVNAVNSIERFTEDAITIEADEENGLIELWLEENCSDKTALLLDSLVLGLEMIQNNYGNDYITLIFKEV